MNDDNAKDIARINPSIQATSDDSAIEDIRRMFVDEIQVPRIVDNKQTPAKRAAFAKTHGICFASFQVVDDLPERYQIGIFKPGRHYTAWVRYSSDIAQTDPDFNSTVGIGIKLFGITGKKSIAEEADGNTLDFILQNTEVFFASDATDMANFKAAAISGNLDAFLAKNPELAAVLASMKKKVDTLVGEPLWSCVPFKFGDDYCKFKLHASILPKTDHVPDFSASDYLGYDLAYRLMHSQVELDFFVQLRNNPAKQSITDARNLWDEREAFPFKVATLTLHKQNIRARQQQEYGESLSFNLWRTLPEMEPVGSIAEARKVTYQSSAEVRRNVNGQSIGEPDKPRASQLAERPDFIPTPETPWPVGELGNATENFRGFGALTIPPLRYMDKFKELTVSARDVKNNILINQELILNGIKTNEGISYINHLLTRGSLRILFEKHQMQRVVFDIIVSSISPNMAGLQIDAYRNNTRVLLAEVATINGQMIIESRSDIPFNLLIITFNTYTYGFNLNNFIMTFA